TFTVMYGHVLIFIWWKGRTRFVGGGSSQSKRNPSPPQTRGGTRGNEGKPLNGLSQRRRDDRLQWCSMKNRSVPVDTVLPHIVYKNLPAAIEWLNKAFGFREHYRYGEQSGAQMHLDNAYIMVRSARAGDATAKPGAEQTASLTVFV